jgi:hypothetical protein
MVTLLAFKIKKSRDGSMRVLIKPVAVVISGDCRIVVTPRAGGSGASKVCVLLSFFGGIARLCFATAYYFKHLRECGVINKAHIEKVSIEVFCVLYRRVGLDDMLYNLPQGGLRQFVYLFLQHLFFLHIHFRRGRELYLDEQTK